MLPPMNTPLGFKPIGDGFALCMQFGGGGRDTRRLPMPRTEDISWCSDIRNAFNTVPDSPPSHVALDVFLRPSLSLLETGTPSLMVNHTETAVSRPVRHK